MLKVLQNNTYIVAARHDSDKIRTHPALVMVGHKVMIIGGHYYKSWATVSSHDLKANTCLVNLLRLKVKTSTACLLGSRIYVFGE